MLLLLLLLLLLWLLLLTRLQLTDIDSHYSIYTMVNIQDHSLFIKYSKDRSLYRWHHTSPYGGAIGRTASTFTTQNRMVATSDGLRVPSPQRAPLYLCRTVRWRHRTDCEFLHSRGHHSIYAGPYDGDIGRTASSFTAEGTTLSMQDRTVATSDGLRVPSPQRAPLYLCRTVRSVHRHSLNLIRRILYEGTIKSLRRTVHFYDDDYGMKD